MPQVEAQTSLPAQYLLASVNNVIEATIPGFENIQIPQLEIEQIDPNTARILGERASTHLGYPDSRQRVIITVSDPAILEMQTSKDINTMVEETIHAMHLSRNPILSEKFQLSWSRLQRLRELHAQGIPESSPSILDIDRIAHEELVKFEGKYNLKVLHVKGLTPELLQFYFNPERIDFSYSTINNEETRATIGQVVRIWDTLIQTQQVGISLENVRLGSRTINEVLQLCRENLSELGEENSQASHLFRELFKVNKNDANQTSVLSTLVDLMLSQLQQLDPSEIEKLFKEIHIPVSSTSYEYELTKKHIDELSSEEVANSVRSALVPETLSDFELSVLGHAIEGNDEISFGYADEETRVKIINNLKTKLTHIDQLNIDKLKEALEFVLQYTEQKKSTASATIEHEVTRIDFFDIDRNLLQVFSLNPDYRNEYMQTVYEYLTNNLGVNPISMANDRQRTEVNAATSNTLNNVLHAGSEIDDFKLLQTDVAHKIGYILYAGGHITANRLRSAYNQIVDKYYFSQAVRQSAGIEGATIGAIVKDIEDRISEKENLEREIERTKHELDILMEPVAKVIAHLVSGQQVEDISFPAWSGLLGGYSIFLSNLSQETKSTRLELLYRIECMVKKIGYTPNNTINLDSFFKAGSISDQMEILKKIEIRDFVTNRIIEKLKVNFSENTTGENLPDEMITKLREEFAKLSIEKLMSEEEIYSIMLDILKDQFPNHEE